MKKTIANNFITIQGWMVEQLNLKGNQLLAYALIYGFSQDGVSEFTGSVSYVEQWLGCARSTAFETLQKLEKAGHIVKRDIHEHGTKYCAYQAVVPKTLQSADDQKQKNVATWSENQPHTESGNQTQPYRNSDKIIPEIGPNNIYNIKDNIDAPVFDEVWNLYEWKGNYLKAKVAYYNLSKSDRQLVHRHLVGSEYEIGYLEATEAAGRKYRQNFEKYLTSGTWKRELEEREMMNLELV